MYYKLFDWLCIKQKYIGFYMRNIELHYNRKDLILTPNVNWSKLNEAKKIDPNLVKGFPINKPMKFNRDLMIKAIQNGMVLLINYRGDKDKWRGGRERVICPLVFGRNKNTNNMLIRGWHLDGWSVSEKSTTEKVWRLFKTDNIMTMTFTGDFFRLPPQGYKRNDRVMTEVSYVAADFNIIRRNQNKLVQQGKIQDEKETKTQKNEQISVELKNTGTILNLQDVWENEYFDKKNQDFIKVSFLKSIFGNKYIAVLGAQGGKDNLVKFYENRKLMGAYKVILSLPDSTSSLKFDNQIKKHRNISNQVEWDLYTFVKKL